MPNEKISQLVDGSPAQATDLIPIARGAYNYSLTAQDIANLSTSGAVGPFAYDSLMLPYEGGGSTYGTPGGTTFEGYFGPAGSSTTDGVGTIQFTLGRYFTVTTGGITIATTYAGGYAFYGIYDTSGALLTQFKFSTTTAGKVTCAASPSVTLAPGVYILGIGGDNATATGYAYQFDSAMQNFQPFNGIANHVCTPGAGGGMPATLGGFSVSALNEASWAYLVLLS